MPYIVEKSPEAQALKPWLVVRYRIKAKTLMRLVVAECATKERADFKSEVLNDLR